MSDIFVSYARSTAHHAQAVAEALRGLGYRVWLDDELPAHRGYADVIEERLRDAKAVVVIWSAEAVKSQWVQSEADRAREADKLVQLTVDGARLPMPFDRIQCADLAGWTGDLEAPGWRKVAASVADLVGGEGVTAPPAPVMAPPPPSLPSKPSIAVLPFVNLSGDAAQDYFADGMVEEIVAALSRIRSIFVIASGSGLSFKGKGVSAQEAARQLGVRYVLEGSVRQAGGRVRIGVRLIDAADGAQVWSDRIEDTLEDVFALQDTVALRVAGQIEPTVSDAEVRRAAKRPTDNMGSYDLYLRAISHFIVGAKPAVLQALDLLYRAIELDPDYAWALSTAAVCEYLVTLYGWSDDRAASRERSIEMAHRALKAAGDDAMVLSQVALTIADLEGDMDAAIALADRAMALNPGASMAWAISGALRVRAGDADLASEHLECSIRLDPIGATRPTRMGLLAQARYFQGRFAEAVALSKEFVQQTESAAGYAFLAAGHGRLGQRDAAQAALERYRVLSPMPIEFLARAVLRDPTYVDLFLEGIGLAEGKTR
jgi:TolB-like protein/Tfp pilus assembly protein PilF